MKKLLVYFTLVIAVCSCDHSKWETISGTGISDTSADIEQAIYFEDESSGVIGGYAFADNTSYIFPVLYLTNDGGKKWRKIHFDSDVTGSICNAYLHKDTLICNTDSSVLFSTNRGASFRLYKDSSKRSEIHKHFLRDNNAQLEHTPFSFQGKHYMVKERYQNSLASVIVCYGGKALTDYYFVSFDDGENWKFLQEDIGDNRQRFLLADKFLYCYDFVFGLKRLRLKQTAAIFEKVDEETL